MTEIVLIAAVARNGVIGAGPEIPWRLPGDLARFKHVTMGHTMLMGRVTFESIGRALPGRRTIVVTRSPQWRHADVETAHSWPEALAVAGPADMVFVVGGGQLYAEAMPYAHRLLVTEVPLEPEGDVHFPPIDPDQWRETSREELPDRAYVEYERR